jgi:hypothetical protein
MARLLPRDASFADLFATSAGHLVAGADLLARALGAADEAERGEAAGRLHDLEHTADEGAHEIVRRVNASFVLPWDRGDAYALASALDDCMDHLEAAADLAVRYAVGALPAGTSELVAVLQRQAEVTAAAMPRLTAARDLAEYWVEVNRLQNHAGAVHRELVGDLFAREPDVVRVLKVKELLDGLRAATAAFEAVAHVVEMIAVKDV